PKILHWLKSLYLAKPPIILGRVISSELTGMELFVAAKTSFCASVNEYLQLLKVDVASLTTTPADHSDLVLLNLAPASKPNPFALAKLPTFLLIILTEPPHEKEICLDFLNFSFWARSEEHT